MPTPEEVDDLALDLPPSDGAHDDEDTESAFDDDAPSGDDDESVGLDVSVGFDQEADLGDLIDDLQHEERRWTEGTEAASDLITLDTRELEEGDEYGWTDDNDAAGDAVAHRDDELDDGALPTLGTDADDEGFDDERPTADGDDADLPPIDAGEGDGEAANHELVDSTLLGKLDELNEREPDMVEVGSGVRWPCFPRSQLQATTLGEAPPGGDLLHVGARLWYRHDQQLAINLDTAEPVQWRAGAPISRVVVETSTSAIASTARGLFRVLETTQSEALGGPSADAGMIANAAIACTIDGARTRLWAQSMLGTLFARLYDPVRWSLIDCPRPGRHLASDGRRSLAYVHARHEGGCNLVQSRDAGGSWSSRSLPFSDAALIRRVLICRDVVAVVSESMTTPVLLQVGDQDIGPCVDGLQAPLALIYEDSEVVLYGVVVTPERVLLIRKPLGQPHRNPSVVATWLAAEAIVPSSISAHHAAGSTDLVVVERGYVRRFRLDIERDNVE